MRMIWQAYSELLSFEFPLFRRDFSAIHDKVRNAPLRAPARETVTPLQVCHAIDVAAALYFKQVLCLQRSAATACLLKKHGYSAEMVIGVQHLPFLAHAWVELNGRVVNDKQYISEVYSVLTRC
jgi:hypothetical protein